MKRDRTFLLRFSILLALLLGFLFSAESFAGTVDTDFSAIVTKLNDWPPAHSGPGACACHLCCRRRHGYRPTVRHRRRRGGRGCADLELRPADHHRDHCSRRLILADWLAFGRPRRFGQGFRGCLQTVAFYAHPPPVPLAYLGHISTPRLRQGCSRGC